MWNSAEIRFSQGHHPLPKILATSATLNHATFVPGIPYQGASTTLGLVAIIAGIRHYERQGEGKMLQETLELDATDEDDLRRQYHELAELAGSLAHEIKNPLSVIHMNADLLSEELGESEWPGRRRAEAKVDMIRQQCQRMENLLRDFLRFARMRDLEMTPGSLNEQVETVLRLFKPQADKFGVEVLRYLDNDLPSVLLHSDSLQAALINLVKNALEAMPDGGQLVVRTYTTPRGAALDLIDTGCGMDDTTAIKMFEPFYSTKHGGSGLGLPTARKIIEAHGGRISVQSEVGRGTKFMLEFPVPARLQ